MPSEPSRRRRAESFFGIHFDFHCTLRDRNQGRRVTPALIRRVLTQLKPDYIQIDGKGHPGVTSYPSRFGTTAPHFVRNPLPLWRRETARAGVALFIHYSGVWDRAAVEKHPDWAAVELEGQRSRQITSVFGPYVDRLMIPQILELANQYGVDGVWVDGDCWATIRDASARARAAWRRATGKRTIPRSPSEPDWFEFSEFCRDAFRKYQAHYVDAVHREAPGFQVASNWAYSSHMPEWPAMEVDFLSGDFWPHDSLNSARFEGRILACQGKPWDLMSWGFATRSADQFRHRTPKTSLQLKQEAALVLALGGGYQCYFNQKRDGSVSAHDLDLYAPVADFCRERQAWCHRTQSASEIALLYSTSGFYRQASNLFSPWGGVSDAYRGVLQALVEDGLGVDTIHDGHLHPQRPEQARSVDSYRLVIVPEWKHLSPDARHALLRYAESGGSVLLLGVATARLMAPALGVRVGPDLPETLRYWSMEGPDGHPVFAGLWGCFAKSIRSTRRGVRFLGQLFTEQDRSGPALPAASVRRYGKGTLAAIYAPLGERYLTGRDVAVRRGLRVWVNQLMPNPLVQLMTPACVDLTVQKKDGDLRINLCNTAGPHAADFTWDVLPPTGRIELRIRLDRNPRSIQLQPANRRLTWRRQGRYLHVTVPSFELHQVVVVRSS
jgi:hypothetical protein